MSSPVSQGNEAILSFDSDFSEFMKRKADSGVDQITATAKTVLGTASDMIIDTGGIVAGNILKGKAQANGVNAGADIDRCINTGTAASKASVKQAADASLDKTADVVKEATHKSIDGTLKVAKKSTDGVIKTVSKMLCQ